MMKFAINTHDLWRLCVVIVIIAAISLIAHVQVAGAQDAPVTTVTDDQVNAIANKLYCPVCENITLDTCGTAACADWRYEIRLQLESGMTEEQIVEDFVRRFGDRVVGTPMDPLLRALSLGTPWLLVAVALGAVALVFRRRRTEPVAMPASPAPTTRYQDLLEQDIAG
ncbi:MAG TPA: cytochrome c-type biogenesis protein CcmH [Aggregatilineales bacterium]|nr:cytochrome c-type biogenesis protein CcmH [Anaerolineae bacterium]HUN06795.1 cytochrome c-type biogenesis protein CcmH [Aggregatilineales bacterium]